MTNERMTVKIRLLADESADMGDDEQKVLFVPDDNCPIKPGRWKPSDVLTWLADMAEE